MRNMIYRMYKTAFSLIGFITLSFIGTGQISLKDADLNKLPKGIKYEGQVKKALRWNDSAGDNIILLTETGIYQNARFKHENEGNDAELYAYHYLVTNDSAYLTWRIYDYISDCPVDIEAEFIIDAFRVTDLNKNGYSEIWTMYKTVCHGDVSPSDLKIIMYENDKKFAMRGQNKVFEGTDEKGTKHYAGGKFKFDEAFSKSPVVFKDYAKKLWNKYMLQQ